MASLDYKIGIIITTFERDALLFKSIASLLANWQDNFELIIVDQGNRTPEKQQWILDNNLVESYYYVPYNSGLSFCRNYGVQIAYQKNCEYVVIGSDSFLFNESIKRISHLIPMARDLIGFELDNCVCGWEARLKLIPGKYFELDFIDKPTTQWYAIELFPCDIVRNLFLAKTQSLLDVPWDNNLKCREHESVLGNTPIFLKTRHGIQVLPIKELMKSQEPPIKKTSTENKTNYKTFEIWTDKGWSKIKYIKRHPCTKKIYRILTSGGYIECTDDHSLIINNKIITPSQLKIGDNIELIKMPPFSNKLHMSTDLAWLLGFFLADGSLAIFKKSKIYSQINLSFTNTNLNLLEKCKTIFNSFGVDTKIIKDKIGYKGSYNKKPIYKLLTCGKNKHIFNSLFSQFYLNSNKIIPLCIYDFDKESRQSFVNGFIDGDGYKGKTDRIGSYKISQKSSTVIQGICYLIEDKYTLNYHHHNNQLYFKLNINKSNLRKIAKDTIKKIEIYNYDGFVYDVETENHHFCGGIGNVNLHNSFFWEYKLAGLNVVWTNYINATKMTDKPSKYKTIRDVNMEEGLKYLQKKYNITGWVHYKNFERAKNNAR